MEYKNLLIIGFVITLLILIIILRRRARKDSVKTQNKSIIISDPSDEVEHIYQRESKNNGNNKDRRSKPSYRVSRRES